MNSYQSLTDETLAALAAKDSAAGEALLLRYKNFVKKIVRPYFIIGADQEDLIQEGMLGLHKAIRDFRPNKAASFASFAAICVKTQVLTAIKNASRKKHGPLNTYIPLEFVLQQDNPESLNIADNSHNPEKLLIFRESARNIENIVNTALSQLESAILLHFLAGMTYGEIAEKLSITSKSVDNALFRIRRKVAKSIKTS